MPAFEKYQLALCRCSAAIAQICVTLWATFGYVYNLNMHDVVVYSRKGCHLCEVVKETITKIQSEADFRWREVDIDARPELQQQYANEVPVVFIDGRKAFKYRMDGNDFLRALAARE